jgi:2-keto-4-pentenoate hydratase/2-oxohepta-3-ene-1,7-dioic acid hydratase in catechol pathway
VADTWSLTQYRDADGSTRIGVLADGLRRAPADWPSSTLALFDDWAAWLPVLRALDPVALEPVGAEQLLSITHPRKVLCAGANYYDHAEEMGTARPDPAEAPFFFLKPPTTTLIPSGTDIVVGDLEAAELDWEVELALVIGYRCRDVAVADALAQVAGYAVSNDVSARGRFRRPNAVLEPFGWDWVQHKAFDGSNPLGPIVPAWQVTDPGALRIALSVNGQRKQDSSTSQLVVDVAHLIAAASRMLTLEPGDVIMTGTPAGVGMPRRTFLRNGDVMLAEIEGLGQVENRVVAA